MARGLETDYEMVIMTAQAETLGGLGRTQTALMRLLLRNKRGLTVDGIAGGLAVTRTAVTQHLAALERDGYVERRDIVASGGRPSRVFALSERGVHLFPKKYDLFSLKALEALIDALGPEEAKKVLERLGRGLGESLGDRLRERTLSERMKAVTAVLQDFGFEAHLEEEGREPRPVIGAYNCIYHSLARAHPEVCALDLALLREASGAEVDHLACMAKGDNACRFRFAKAKSAARRK